MKPVQKLKKNWRTGIKQKKMRSFYSQYLPPESLCFDVGAHTGEISSILLQLHCKVVGFEPLDSCAPKLQQLANLHNNRFIYHKAALSNQTGSALLYVGSHPEISTLSTDFINEYKNQQMISWSSGIPVPTLTIQDAIDAYTLPRFIKIDAEGYEPLILEKLATPIEYVQMEWNKRMTKEAIASIQHLERLGGYTYNWWPGETYSFAEPVNISAAEIIHRLQHMPIHILTGEIWAARDARN